MSAVLEPMDHGGRLGRLIDAMPDGIDGLLVTSLTHVRYLTGFAGSAGVVLASRHGSLLITDHRYGEVAGELAVARDGDVSVVVGVGPEQSGAVADASAGWGSVGIEAEHVTVAALKKYEAEWFTGPTVVPTEGVVAGIRLVKDAGEVARIEAAAEITDDALAAVRPLLATSPTEREFQLALDRAIIDRGAADLSFDTIVASGPNAARPHHVPGDRMIDTGDLVVIDVGALVDGYHSDMTRSFSIGTPGTDAARMIDVVTEAQAQGVATVAPGVTGDAIDAAARRVIGDAGLGEEFVHGVGHGVGLLIHEDPFLKGSEVPLLEGQVVTVEPGVYRSGFGGVRVEDTVVVTATGCRSLTHSPKEPVVVD